MDPKLRGGAEGGSEGLLRCKVSKLVDRVRVREREKAYLVGENDIRVVVPDDD